MMQDFINLAERLAQSSSAIIQQYFRAEIHLETKSDGTPVTIADKKAEEAMREIIMREFPTHGIIGEEFGDYQPDAEYRWILDPIDGTKSFVSGSFLFGTLIALMRGDQPILGVINHPIGNQFLLGANGETRLNGKRVHVRPCQRIEEATLLTTSHWGIEAHHDGAAFESLSRRAKLYRTWGDCHGYYLVATGYADIMLDPVMKLWDLAALIPIIEGAGGKTTDWRGGDALKGKGVIATAGGLHAEVVRVLNP